MGPNAILWSETNAVLKYEYIDRVRLKPSKLKFISIISSPHSIKGNLKRAKVPSSLKRKLGRNDD